MTEARQLKTGRWRLYKTPNVYPVRDPQTGEIVTFGSLAEARRWWRQHYPGEGAPYEAIKCAKCGAYFGRGTTPVLSGGLYYHATHSPDFSRRR
ncbi:MAG TPA: hypothetical protein VIT43_06960 [Candidatus Dormibacteraeota bacterium]